MANAHLGLCSSLNSLLQFLLSCGQLEREVLHTSHQLHYSHTLTPLVPVLQLLLYQRVGSLLLAWFVGVWYLVTMVTKLSNLLLQL